MDGFDVENIEKILIQLEMRGIFGLKFRFTRNDDGLNIIAMGQKSCVFEMCDSEYEERVFAAKVMGFGSETVDGEKIKETVFLHNEMARENDCIVKIFGYYLMKIELDDDYRVVNSIGAKSNGYEAAKGIEIHIIVMEKLESIIENDENGNIHLKNEILFSELQSMSIRLAIDICCGLDSLHEAGYVHRDIKLENIFWDERNERFKLGDFDVVEKMGYYDENTSEKDWKELMVAFSEGYVAPEIRNNNGEMELSPASDIYSLGISIFLLLNNLCFPDSEGYIPNSVQYKKGYEIPTPVNSIPGITMLIRKMCNYYPELRYNSLPELMLDVYFFLEKNEFDEADTETYNQAYETGEADTETYNQSYETDEADTETYSERDEADTENNNQKYEAESINEVGKIEEGFYINEHGLNESMKKEINGKEINVKDIDGKEINRKYIHGNRKKDVAENDVHGNIKTGPVENDIHGNIKTEPVENAFNEEYEKSDADYEEWMDKDFEDMDREERKRMEEYLDKKYTNSCIKRVFLLSLFFCFFFISRLPDLAVEMTWAYLIIPISVFLEGSLQSTKKFNVEFGIVCIIASVLFMIKFGISSLFIMIIVSVLLNTAGISVACAGGIMIWMLWNLSGRLLFLNILNQWNFGWLIFLLIFGTIVEYALNRISYGRENLQRKMFWGLLKNLVYLIWLPMFLYGIVIRVLNAIKIMEISQELLDFHLPILAVAMMIILAFLLFIYGYFEEENHNVER